MSDPIVPVLQEEGDAGPSKKGAKKAEAKAKKEAEKARKAAEREAAQAASSTNTEDTAAGNYGKVTPTTASTLGGEKISLEKIGEEHVGKTVRFSAVLQNVRKQSAKLAFTELRARRDWAIQGLIQEGEGVSRQMIKWATTLSAEGRVLVEAVVNKPEVPIKSTRITGYELHIKKLYLQASAPEKLGMTMLAANSMPAKPAKTLAASETISEDATDLATATLEVHLNNPIIHKRAPVSKAINRIRSEVLALFPEFLRKHGFIQFTPPCFVGAATEGGSDVFEVKYFETKAYLAQSPQFYKQGEIAGGEDRVFCIGPVFRAEKSNTPRHLTEFTGLDLEMVIEEHYHEVLHMLQNLLLYIFRGLEENCKYEIDYIRSIYPSEPYLLPEPGKEVVLTFAEGQKLLREEGGPEWANVTDHEDMSTPQEKALGALVRKKYNTDFYVLDKFPTTARPFYAMPDPEDPRVTNAFDFFMRGQEILSGGQRIHLPEELKARMRSMEPPVDPEAPGIKEYVGFFEAAGVAPHGGSGIGLDRIVAWYLNLPSVQLSSNWPRTPARLGP